MSRGGARVRSGPPVDPNSARSDARGLTFSALPADGYGGEVPEFPIPVSKGSRVLKLWEDVWRSPQGAAWINEPYRWHAIAEYCMLMRDIELDPTRASLIGQVHRYRDQLGLTPAGLRENGWLVGHVEESPGRSREAKKSKVTGSRARYLKAVGSGE